MIYPLARALLLPGALLALGLCGVIIRTDARARLGSACLMWLAVGLACLDVSRKHGSSGGEVMLALLVPTMWAFLLPARWVMHDNEPPALDPERVPEREA